MYTHIYTYMYTHTYTRIYVCTYACIYTYMCTWVYTHTYNWASWVALVLKDPRASAEDIEGLASIPGSGRSPGGGNSDRLQYSCLENPMDRGAWRATIRSIRVGHD